jgi:hypothetical protein
VRALRRDPRVALTIDTDSQPPNVLLVRGVVTVEIVDGVPGEYLAASQKGLPRDQWAAFEQAVRSTYPAMARISMTPQWAKVLDSKRACRSPSSDSSPGTDRRHSCRSTRATERPMPIQTDHWRAKPGLTRRPVLGQLRQGFGGRSWRS